MSKEGVEQQDIMDEFIKFDNSMQGAMINRKLVAELSEQQRIALAGEIARSRYVNMQSITQVYRNAGHLANPLIMQIVQDADYPASKHKLNEFFQLAKKAQKGNKKAKKELAKKLQAVPDAVIQALMPMYHEFMSDVGKESKEEATKGIIGISNERKTMILAKLGVTNFVAEDIDNVMKNAFEKLSKEEVLNIRKQEARVSFIGTVAFSFIEQRAMELDDPAKSTLQTAFRNLRNADPSILDGLMNKLEAANKNYVPSQPLDHHVGEVVQRVKKEVEVEAKLVKEHNEAVEKRVIGTNEDPGVARNLMAQCAELKKALPKKEAQALEEIRLAFGRTYDELKVSVALKGNKVSDSDIKGKLLETVNKTVNGKSLLTIAIAQGNKEAVKQFIQAGANINNLTYKRSFAHTLKDGFNDFPNNLSKLFSKPPRDIQEIAKISGNEEMVNFIQNEFQITKQKPPYDQQQVDLLNAMTVPSPQEKKMDIVNIPNPPFTQLRDQMSQQLPKDATPLQIIQHEIGMMLESIKKEIEAAQKNNDPFSVKMFMVDVKLLETIRRTLASNTDVSSKLEKMQDAISKAEGERKAANHNLAPVHSKTTLNMMDMLERHQGKMEQMREPANESKESISNNKAGR